MIGIEATSAFGPAEVAILRDSRHLETVPRFQNHRNTAGKRIRISQCAARLDVADIAVLLVIVARHADFDDIGHRNIERALNLDIVALATLDGEEATEVVTRLCRFVQNGAASRIASEQSALRPL